MSRNRESKKRERAGAAREKGAPFEFVCPGQRDEPISVEDLEALSGALVAVLEAGELDRERVCALRAVAAAPGEVIGRARREKEDLQVLPGIHVSLDEQGAYRAERYGYICLQEGALSVLPPLWMDERGLEVYWLVLDEGPRPVTRRMIEECLGEMGVVEGVQGKVIDALIEQMGQGQHSCGAVLVAQGTPPVDEQGEELEMAVEPGRLAGQRRDDDSLDFRQINYAPAVQQGQVLARRRPGRAGVPGRSVKGAVVAPRRAEERPLQAGENVAVRFEAGAQVFAASISGVLRVGDGRLSVVRFLNIEGHVDFNTGNLDFDGTLHIQGSVLSGFSVKATGDIAVAATVEAGAGVVAGGDLSVGGGIVGRRTRVLARGHVRAQYVQEATVTAGGDIELGGFAYQARLRAGGRVCISQGEGARAGSAVGGQVGGRRGVDLFVAGSAAHVSTVLMAGVDPEQAHKLDQLRESVDLTYAQVRRLLERFGLARVDVVQIQNRIAAASGPRRKLLVTTARRLGEVVQMHQKLLAARQKIEQSVGAEVERASVQVRERAFAGVEVRLGDWHRKLQEDLQGSVFRIVDGKIVDGRGEGEP